MELAWHSEDLNLISLSARLPFIIPDKVNHFPYPSFSPLEWRRPFKYLIQASFKQKGKIMFSSAFLLFLQVGSHLKAQSSIQLWLYAVANLESDETQHIISNVPYMLQDLISLESLPFQNYGSVIRYRRMSTEKLINKMHSWPITSNNLLNK